MSFGDWVNKQIKDTTGYDPGTGQGNAFLGPFGGQGQFSGSKNAAQGGQDAVYDPTQQPAMDAAKQQYDLRKQQVALATDFENPGGIQQDIYNKFRNERLRDLGTDQQSTQRGLSKRGLGYGGIAQGANARLQGDAEYDLQTGKSKIRSAAEEQAQQIKADTLNTAVQQKNAQQVIFNHVYSSALDEYRNRRNTLKAVGQGAGAIIGTAYGGPVGGAAGSAAGGEALG